MKKIIFPKFSKIALSMSIVFLGMWILIKTLESFNIYLYSFGIGTKEIKPIIILIAIALLISSIAVLLFKNSKHKVLLVITTTILSILIFPYLLIIPLFSTNSTYFEYTSDDDKHDIVVEECAFLLAGYGDIYY